jgi:hypothetical protein
MIVFHLERDWLVAQRVILIRKPFNKKRKDVENFYIEIETSHLYFLLLINCGKFSIQEKTKKKM